MSGLIKPVSSFMLLAWVLAGGATTAFSHQQNFPLTVENCGQNIRVNLPPQRVVTIGQASTELLYHLGLHDRVVGTSNWFTDVSEEFDQVNSRIERLADNFPSFERVVSKRPDLVTADFMFAVGPQGVVGKREQFHSLGVNTYVMDSECPELRTDGASSGPVVFSLDKLFQSIRNLSRIFDVQHRGEALISEIKNRESAVILQSSQQGYEKLSAVFWFSSADIQMDPWVAGSTGVPAWMLASLGIRNVIDAKEEWPSVGWESIARANPDILVIAEMTRRRFDGDDYRKKLEFLRTDSVTRHMDAVLNDRIVIMDAQAMRATLRSIDGLEKLSAALKDMDFARE